MRLGITEKYFSKPRVRLREQVEHFLELLVKILGGGCSASDRIAT
jgi:hypothetical protein